MKDTDQLLIHKTLAGDTRAYCILVERYQNFVYTIIYRVVKVREEAEEVAQDTFLKAYENLGQFRGESRFSTWLYRIAYRKALDKIKSSSRRVTLELLEDVTGGEVKDLETGLDFLLQEERSRLLQECLGKLPGQDAALVTLFYFEEQSIKEIAVVTGLSEENVKVKLYRSRKILFSLLEKYMEKEIPFENGKAI